MALQIIITRWTRAPIKYESVFNPPPQTQKTLNIHESIRYSLEEIAQTAGTKGPWGPSAYKHIQTRLGNIQTMAHIIEHTAAPPEISENQIETLKQWREWANTAMEQAGAQLARALEIEHANQVARTAIRNKQVAQHFSSGMYSKALKAAGLSSNGSNITKPTDKLIEQVQVPALNKPGREVLTPNKESTEACVQDFFRARFHPKMESVSLRYGPEIPPMQCFKDLLSHWADIEKPTAGRKAPYYATRKQKINENAPRIAHEIHELMQTNEYHAECLQDTLNLKHFTWQKCQKAAQKMKHHTAPGASGISIDMLLLLPKEGWQTISLIFKTIIRTGVYPDIFKVGIITLLAKS